MYIYIHTSIIIITGTLLHVIIYTYISIYVFLYFVFMIINKYFKFVIILNKLLDYENISKINK
jgi:hypothetical protein